MRLLILSGASVMTRDKDGTALDSALKRLVKMLRGLAAATDKDHPDRPILEAAAASLGALARAASRGEPVTRAFPSRCFLEPTVSAARRVPAAKHPPCAMRWLEAQS